MMFERLNFLIEGGVFHGLAGLAGKARIYAAAQKSCLNKGRMDNPAVSLIYPASPCLDLSLAVAVNLQMRPRPMPAQQ